MARLRRQDLVIELIELCQDIMDDVRSQLNYFRASVYKDETANVIRQKIDQLRLLTSLFGDDLAQDPLRDYDAMAANAAQHCVPGECSFSNRVTLLLKNLESQFPRLQNQASHSTSANVQFTKTLQKHRRQLLAMCRHGSRQYQLFQAI